MFDLMHFNDNIAVITDDGQTIKYIDLYNYQNELANYLGQRKVVLILCENVLGCLIGYLCCIINRIVPILIHSKIDKLLLNSLLDTYHPTYIWMPEKLNCFDESVVFHKWNYKLIKYNKSSNYAIYEDLALLLQTSGSTGSVKMVRISYENLLENTKSIIRFLPISITDKAITSLPMCYSFGLSVINTYLFSGACLLLTKEKVVNHSFWSFLAKYGGTSFYGVPYTFSTIRKLNFSNMTLPSLKLLAQAGGKISKSDCKYFLSYSKANGCKFFVMYGQTEATARISYVPYEMLDKKVGSVGIAVPKGNIKISDSNGENISTANTVGEIVYTGKNVSLGYSYSLRDLRLSDENHGVLNTGDLGYLDKDGYLFITGRNDRTIKLYGNRISLDEMEELLDSKFLARFICCYKSGRIYVFSEKSYYLNEIELYLAAITNLNKDCFKYLNLPQIPYTYNGKCDYKRIEQLAEERRNEKL